MMPWRYPYAMVLLLGIALALPASTIASGPAAVPFEPTAFDNPEDEVRYQRLLRDLRCTVCQNQNLIESNAPLALEMRRIIGQMINEGAEANEVKDFMVARYGDFVLFRPPMKSTTYLLWYGPIAMLFIGLAVLGTILWRRKTQVGSVPLSAEEEERLSRILGKGSGDKA